MPGFASAWFLVPFLGVSLGGAAATGPLATPLQYFLPFQHLAAV